MKRNREAGGQQRQQGRVEGGAARLGALRASLWSRSSEAKAVGGGDLPGLQIHYS